MPNFIPIHLDLGTGNTPASAVIQLPEADLQRLAHHAAAARLSVGDWLKQELTRSIETFHPSSAPPDPSPENPATAH